MERPCQQTAPDCIEAALRRELSDAAQSDDEALLEAANEGEYDADDTGSSELFVCRSATCAAYILLHEYNGADEQTHRFISRMP